jgi:hypothetical protein
VTPGGRRFVAKLADHLDAEALAGGLRVAEFAAVRGLACGDPLRTPNRPGTRLSGCLARARWVAQAIYFASRIERGIHRGHTSPTANEDGLAAAYHGMTK